MTGAALARLAETTRDGLGRGGAALGGGATRPSGSIGRTTLVGARTGRPLGPV
jgi:hypothetical protein